MKLKIALLLLTCTQMITNSLRLNTKLTVRNVNKITTTYMSSFDKDTVPKEDKKKDEFTATRVFIQGIPPEVSWPELKDHFKKSGGNVVYASISVDKVTNKPKGCGIVQYETSEEASEAIRVMGDHSLRGEKLFVRADIQEKRSTGKFTTPWKLGLRKTPRSAEDKERALSKSDFQKKPRAPREDKPRKDGKVKLSDGTLVDPATIQKESTPITSTIQNKAKPIDPVIKKESAPRSPTIKKKSVPITPTITSADEALNLADKI